MSQEISPLRPQAGKTVDSGPGLASEKLQWLHTSTLTGPLNVREGFVRGLHFSFFPEGSASPLADGRGAPFENFLESLPPDWSVLADYHAPLKREGILVARNLRKGRVFLAWDENSAAPVIVKHSPSFLSAPELEREASALRMITGEGIPKLYKYIQSEERGAYLVSEAFTESMGKQVSCSPSLRALLGSRHGAPPSERALQARTKFFRALLPIVLAVHSQDVLHLDIKPENIIFTHNGRPALIDFGLAISTKLPNPSLSSHLEGSPGYIPPEEIYSPGKNNSPSRDVYALGVTLYEMLTGRTPVPLTGAPHVVLMRTLRHTPPSPRDLCPVISTDLSDLVMACIDKDRSKRVRSVSELQDRLQTVARF